MQTNYKPFIQVAIYSFIFYNAAMNTISFNTANFVAQQVGYNMTLGWGQGDQSNNDYCRPIDTFHDRFETMLSSVTSMGFDTIDLWTGILNYNWAEQRHIDIASNLFQKHKIAVISYAGGFGNNPDEFAKACHLCKSLNIPILGGGTPLISSDRDFLTGHLRENNLRFGYENHPERSIEEILQKIGESDSDVIGIALDTGWLATQGVDAPSAISSLKDRIFHVHLKDVKARRATPSGYQMIDMGHETCALGDGVVGIKQCILSLKQIGYEGGLSIEHEPEDFDPTEDCIESKKRVEEWLAA